MFGHCQGRADTHEVLAPIEPDHVLNRIVESLTALYETACNGVLKPLLFQYRVELVRTVWKVMHEYICKRNIPHMI